MKNKQRTFRFWISNEPIWWNKGVETKPGALALSNIRFEEVVNNENFNISWVDELHIKVIAPIDKEYGLIKIDDTVRQETKYYFLLEELNRTSINKECIFQLDIWCTYIVNGNLGELRTTQNLNINGVSDYVNIRPIGIPSGNLINKYNKINIRESIFTKASEEYGKCFTLTKMNFNGIQDTRNVRIGDNNLYFVFTERKTPSTYELTRNEDNTNYILIPVMNIDKLGLFTVLPGQYVHALSTHIIKSETYAWLYPTWLCNSYETILSVVQNKTDNHLDLGEYLGLWAGPSIYRIKDINLNKKSQIIFNVGSIERRVVDNIYLTLSNNFIEQGEKEKWGFRNTEIAKREYDKFTQQVKANVGSYRGSKFLELIDSDTSINNLWRDTNGVIGDRYTATLIAFRVSNARIRLSDINVNRNDFVKNINYLGNPNNFLTVNETDMFFNQKFTFTNGKDSTDIDIQLPTAYDNYQNMLATQRNTMNTGLWTSGVGSLFSLATQLVGGIGVANLGRLEKHRLEVQRAFNNRVPTNIVDDVEAEKWAVRQVKNNMLIGNSENQITAKNLNRVTVNALLGGNSALQFFNTLAQQEAYKRDLRTTISNTITNMTDNYVFFFKMIERTLSQQDTRVLIETNDINVFMDKLAQEPFFGYEVIPSKLTQFYGYEDIPRLIRAIDFINSDYYLKIDELTKIELDLRLSNKYSPKIKNAILTLLENGVRVYQNKNSVIKADE